MKHEADSPSEIIRFFHSLDRSHFIDNDYRNMADCDQALPIGFGQTISQPSLVLEMTLALELNKKCRVLEIGTGSGYQTAFLAEFAAEVFSMELIPELSKKAQSRLKELGYRNINFQIGDGSQGWLEFAPYDRIIAAAGAASIPPPLLEQLNVGGIMLLPLGPPSMQELILVKKGEGGKLSQESRGEVRFVEFKGDYGWGMQGKVSD